MANAHSPETDPRQHLARIGRIEIPIPPELFETDETVAMVETTLMQDVLADAEDARLHLGAVLGVLEKCDPFYKIETGLFTGNLQPIYARLVRVIDGLRRAA